MTRLAGFALLLLLPAMALLFPPPAAAAPLDHRGLPPLDLSGRTLGRWMQDSLGLTIVVHHPGAPYPDGLFSRKGVLRSFVTRTKVRHRIVTHTERRLVAPPEAFRDDHVLVFLPTGFCPDAAASVILFFHGWNSAVVGSTPICEDLQLRATVAGAGGNYILVVPQGPLNAPASSFGRLELIWGLTDFMDELPDLLPPLPGDDGSGNAWLRNAGEIVLAGHSGGGNPIMMLVMDAADRDLDGQGEATPQERAVWSKVRRLIFLDATYDGLDPIGAWWAAREGRIIQSYFLKGTGTAEVSEGFAALAAQHPERREQMEIEGIRPEDLPPEEQETAHHDMPRRRFPQALRLKENP